MDVFLTAQGLGIIALILICYSYFTKEKSTLLILQVIANIFYACAFIIMHAYAGGIVILISTIRCVEIYFVEKYNLTSSNFVIIIYAFAYACSTFILWQGWLDIIPLIASIIFTIAFAVTDLQKFRCLMVFPNVILLIYSLIHHTYASALLDLVELIVLLVAIAKCKFNGNFPSALNP